MQRGKYISLNLKGTKARVDLKKKKLKRGTLVQLDLLCFREAVIHINLTKWLGNISQKKKKKSTLFS